MNADKTIDFLPLPEPGHRGPDGTGVYFNAFTAQQMRDYVAADRAQRQAEHVGDSAFESWYSEYCPAHNGDKQRARDAYAAGMGERQAVQEPNDEWMSLAHTICADAGIPPGRIEQRLEVLRGLLQAPQPAAQAGPDLSGEAAVGRLFGFR